jgi:DNA polymerase IIIc chi subunit
MNTCTFHDMEPSLRDRKVFDIVEQAYVRGEKVVVFARDGERAAAIDRFLWILRQEAFIPHKIFTEREASPSVPVAIVATEMNPIGAGVLIADGHCSLDFAAGFGIVHEFVDRSSPRLQDLCRERFRAYRARKIPVEHRKS